MKTVFTTGEAAKICKVSQQTIIRCFDSGQLKGFRVPGSRFRRIPRDILYKFMKENGIRIDTSVRSLFDYRAQFGPDYSNHPLAPYWVGEKRDLLELPVTTVYWGPLRQIGKHIHRIQRHIPTFFSGFSRLGLLERIALTPEGVTSKEAIRGINIALGQELPLLVLSFHSPTLAPGFTPYADSEADVEKLYDWLREVYAHLATVLLATGAQQDAKELLQEGLAKIPDNAEILKALNNLNSLSESR